ncbi:MAG: GIY-YIG nuclease family protein [Bacteroidetes bacterium]|nr:GIY-YIG nuclease family protein [Bacteroidota bacterium]MBU1720521.1 GIY-YIG nuclease family protein [Bacteroidota bacterium]
MYAIIDVETTGGSQLRTKITELSIVIFDGEKVVDTFNTLLDPECLIPPFISRLTGITNAMVAGQPKFFEVARKIVEITDNRIFVAHNAQFDYSVIRQEFKNLGYNFVRKTLCTIRLARKVLPGRKSYSLGNICKELEIEHNNQHRAYGDTEATLKLFKLLLDLRPDVGLFEDISTRSGGMQLQKCFDRENLRKIPEATGIYYFLNESGDVIYVGKSKNIRRRVMSHARAGITARKDEMLYRTHSISYEIMGSELVAFLIESEKIKTLRPLFNRAQRRISHNIGLYAEKTDKGYGRLIIKAIDKQLPLTTFSSRAESKRLLYALAAEFELCHSLCNLYQSAGPCFQYQIGECKGACAGAEKPADYNKRLRAAIEKIRFGNKSFFIIEKGRVPGETAVVQVQNGKYIGFGFTFDTIAPTSSDLLSGYIQPYSDNRDVRLILQSYIRKPDRTNVVYY